MRAQVQKIFMSVVKIADRYQLRERKKSLPASLEHVVNTTHSLLDHYTADVRTLVGEWATGDRRKIVKPDAQAHDKDAAAYRAVVLVVVYMARVVIIVVIVAIFESLMLLWLSCVLLLATLLL